MKSGQGIKPENDYVTIKEVISINGSGIVVAVICMVIYTIIPFDDDTAKLVLRWLSISLSMAASYLIFINTNYGIPKSKEMPTPRVNFVALWIINGCFIYLSAAGVNYLNNSRSFASDVKRSGAKTETTSQATLIPFLKDISWFPDAKLVQENKYLTTALKQRKNNKDVNSSLVDTIQRLTVKYQQVKKQSVDSKLINYGQLFILKIHVTNHSTKPLQYSTVYLTDRIEHRAELSDYDSTTTDDSGNAYFVLDRAVLENNALYLYSFYTDNKNSLAGVKRVLTKTIDKTANVMSFNISLGADNFN